MSRSGYNDDIEQWDLIRWRGAVASALRGRRGQAFLRELLASLYALPEKRLIQNDLADEYDGSVCALGAVGKKRGLDMSKIDPEEHEDVAALFSVPHTLACEIMWLNDEAEWPRETPEARWLRVRHWTVDNIIDDAPSPLSTTRREGQSP